MIVLITGVHGQLGRETKIALEAKGTVVVGIDRDDVDFCDTTLVEKAIANYAADWIINCAAYTNVDLAERERDMAFAINRDAAGAVARGAKQSGARLLHVSTDFVFEGSQSRPYSETDEPQPINVYGRSKWEGELAVHEALPDALILRTAWLYGAYGSNFVKKILESASKNVELKVVDDQIGTPTWAGDLVSAMVSLIELEAQGIYHFTNEGVASWYDFAYEILRTGRELGFNLLAEQVAPIAAEEFTSQAKRPTYSIMDKRKIRKLLGYRIPHWKDALVQMLVVLAAREQEVQKSC